MDTAVQTTRATRPHRAVEKSQWVLALTNAVGLVGLLVALFAIQPGSATMRLGGVAEETVVAQRRVTYQDRAATAAKRQLALQSVPTQYKYDPRQAQRRRAQAAVFLSKVQGVIAGSATPAQKVATIRRLLPHGLSSAALQLLPNLRPSDFRFAQRWSLELLDEALAWHFDQNQLQTTAIGLLAAVPARATLLQRRAVGEVVGVFLTPTVVSNFAATQHKQKEAVDRVVPVYSTIQPGEVVVRRGDLITPTIMEKLDALGLQSRHSGWRDVFASFLFAVIIVALLFWYLLAFHRTILTNPRLLLLFSASILVTVFAARILTAGHVLLPFFLPAAAASTFAAVLVAPEACLVLALITAVLAGWIVANSFELTLYYFVSSAAGILAIQRMRQLKHFIFAGGYIALFGLATALAFALVDRTYDFAALQQYVLAAAFNGFVSSTLALGAFALLSDFFGVTTSLQLLELGQPNQRLLHRLMTMAPGTYNHSLIVASMVETAAEQIGAHSLVAKVAALYHDVGKTTNPHCFVENQLGMSNIHDQLEPEESARLIRGHVSQGLRLARQHKLPRLILDGIAEHHGTMAIAYFLHKARQGAPNALLDSSLFMYPGPKPQSKETALLMLADGCESAVRASPDRSREKIQEVVQQIFADRIHQGQLDESPLTLHDLDRARSAFCSVLYGLYHPRIEYPEPSEPTDEAQSGATPIPIRSRRRRSRTARAGIVTKEGP